jgi:hypothetical protein
MKRLIQAFLLLGILAVAASVPLASARQPAPGHQFCEDNSPLCTETIDPVNYEGNYTGHDEPSVLFYSNSAGSGNDQVYRLTLPSDPPNPPKQDGTGGTFNFQLHPAFWFGVAMCDDQSAPNPGGSALAGANVPCTPDSDSNIFTNLTPGDPNYIGKHPGTAFMEMQFYAPGWIQWPPGDSCDPSKWCAALNIDSFSENLNLPLSSGGINNNDCLRKAGVEPVNFAFITKNGVATGPANPLDATAATYTPTPSKDLMMHSGDTLTVAMHDTTDGFQVVINDLTTGTSGSMTASTANGFGQVNYDPSASTCSLTSAPFHPMYSTSSEDTRVVWAAHSYNVAFSDEIGHFEYCNAVPQQTANCSQDGVGDQDLTNSGNEDDNYCFVPPFGAPFQSTRVKVGGCFGTDADFDGVPYQTVWPGSTTNAALEAGYHPTPIRFTSPTFNSGQAFNRIAFEADLPRIETDTIPPCNRSTGANCVNPPVVANFYPFFSTASSGGQCVWQEGGDHIPGTTNDFGGSSTTEFGPLLSLVYPGPAGPFNRFNNFRQVLSSNPC